MNYNKNKSDFEFIASEELKTEFNQKEDSKCRIQIIAKITNDTILSIFLKNNSKNSIGLSKQNWHLY
jgi:hypothetical protein